MNNESLTGSLLSPLPDFQDDPVQKQRQAAVMTYPGELHERYVDFPGGITGIYDRNPLLTPKGEPNNNPDALCRTMLLLDGLTWMGTQLTQALARDNSGAWEKAPGPVRQIKRLVASKCFS